MTNNQLEAGDYVTKAVRLVRPLAEGGMGRVWIAEHLGLNAQVVVKSMAPEMAERPDGAERFAREAAACAAIRSPHVVQVFDHGVTADGTPYMVMELLEGKDLGAHLIEHGRMEPMDVVTIVVQVAKALSRAHKAGIIHRDIKPENIFLCETDGGEIFVKLLDFGTARRDTETTSRTTVPGQIMGTPYYMSPEQSVGATELDERSDIWSLGVVAFEALTGQKPFDGPSVGAITIAIHGPLPKLTDALPELPPALDGWFARACAQIPEDRFATVRDASSALVEAVTGTAPAEQATESVCFPSASPRSNSNPATPVTRPVEPLIASLPERGAERRVTTIAAGLVMAVAAVAMVAIVVGRSPEPAEPTSGDAPPAVQAAAAASPPPDPPAPEPEPSQPEPAVEAAPARTEGSSAVAVAKRPATASPAAKAAGPTTTRVADSGRDARAKAKAPQQRGARTAPPAPAKEGPDDDLVRLSNAASKVADSASPEAAPSAPRASTSSTPPETAPAPATSPRPEPPPLPPPAPPETKPES